VTEHSEKQAHTIVVGVDGSDPSRAALRWAIEQARLTGAGVTAVLAWQYPNSYGYAIPVDDADWPANARQVLTTALETVPAGGVPVTPLVVRGNAAEALLDASGDSDLLVVGSRGHGGFVEALLGSVGQHCVHHATCPVVVIPAQRH
jgi:nucleotide-binding universal stress UspA family protein